MQLLVSCFCAGVRSCRIFFISWVLPQSKVGLGPLTPCFLHLLLILSGLSHRMPHMYNRAIPIRAGRTRTSRWSFSMRQWGRAERGRLIKYTRQVDTSLCPPTTLCTLVAFDSLQNSEHINDAVCHLPSVIVYQITFRSWHLLTVCSPAYLQCMVVYII